MERIGFTYYDSIPVPQQPTTAEIVASLTNVQKVAILDGFVKKILPQRLKYQIDVPKIIIVHLYKKIDAIEERARELMRGEIVITSMIIDPKTGEVTKPAVMNTPPTTVAQLLSQVQDDFSDDFTGGQVQAILTKMVAYSKHDGSGDWTFYKENVIL